MIALQKSKGKKMLQMLRVHAAADAINLFKGFLMDDNL